MRLFHKARCSCHRGNGHRGRRHCSLDSQDSCRFPFCWRFEFQLFSWNGELRPFGRTTRGRRATKSEPPLLKDGWGLLAIHSSHQNRVRFSCSKAITCDRLLLNIFYKGLKYIDGSSVTCCTPDQGRGGKLTTLALFHSFANRRFLSAGTTLARTRTAAGPRTGVISIQIRSVRRGGISAPAIGQIFRYPFLGSQVVFSVLISFF